MGVLLNICYLCDTAYWIPAVNTIDILFGIYMIDLGQGALGYRKLSPASRIYESMSLGSQ